MPPRIPTLPAAAPSIIRASAGATTHRVAQPSQLSVVVAAGFSTTASRPKFSKARQNFRLWESRVGRRLRKHAGNAPRYMGLLRPDASQEEQNRTTYPFPINPHFQSFRVLDDKARELIWQKIMHDGETIKAVSAEFGVDIRRVAAIVRLKEVEKDWIARGKTLAKPYARAVLAMVPTYRLNPSESKAPYEPINELHVHPYTMQQIFWPTSESRQFTREDAAKAFHSTLLSTDKRIPHPELVQMEREVLQGEPVWDASQRFKQAVMESERKAAEKHVARAAFEEKMVTRVNTKRFEFRFKKFNSEDVGPGGRSRKAIGWRYGNPFDDRSKHNQIKIPTSVP
ncbi:eukaryotic mitochondrial regulator protein-domain-containing protein [Nemania sp. FL0916]|nr:eukaryotic mitochondrial regulator protein-domain-containing protein [Nemania sp. FL0916]